MSNHGKTASTVTVRATITDGGGVTAGASTSDPFTVPIGSTVVATTSKQLADVRVWSVQSPDLYTVTVDVLSSAGTVIDSVNYTVGVRTISFDTKGLHLNGKSVKVRGFCDHSNFAGVGGA